jgi:hypothetical protein
MTKFMVSYAALQPVFLNVEVEAESPEAAERLAQPVGTWSVLPSGALLPDAYVDHDGEAEGALQQVTITWCEPAA